MERHFVRIDVHVHCLKVLYQGLLRHRTPKVLPSLSVLGMTYLRCLITPRVYFTTQHVFLSPEILEYSFHELYLLSQSFRRNHFLIDSTLHFVLTLPRTFVLPLRTWPVTFSVHVCDVPFCRVPDPPWLSPSKRNLLTAIHLIFGHLH